MKTLSHRLIERGRPASAGGDPGRTGSLTTAAARRRRRQRERRREQRGPVGRLLATARGAVLSAQTEGQLAPPRAPPQSRRPRRAAAGGAGGGSGDGGGLWRPDAAQAAHLEHLRSALLREMHRVLDLFRKFDRNGDGRVSREEFRQVLPLLAPRRPAERPPASRPTRASPRATSTPSSTSPTPTAAATSSTMN